jgi:hypothetical protein
MVKGLGVIASARSMTSPSGGERTGERRPESKEAVGTGGARQEVGPLARPDLPTKQALSLRA